VNGASNPGDEPEWSFGAFRLSASGGRLLRDGVEVALARKSFEILVHLVRHRERVISRRELLEEVWGGASVSEAAVASAIRDLRRGLGDTAGQAQFIGTVRGRGFRFTHPVRELDPPERSNDANAWSAAAIHFERALEALALVEMSRGQGGNRSGAKLPRERGELIVALARARWSGGATDTAREAFGEAADVARQSGNAEILAQAALGFAGRSDVTPGVNVEAVAFLEEALHALPDSDSELRAELLARLGTELYYDEDASRSEELTVAALAMAERFANAPLTAYVCTARHFTSQRPDSRLADRLALSARAIALAEGAPTSDVLAFALQERLVDLFELGDGEAFDETLRRFERAVGELAQPFFDWLASMYRGTRAALAGRVDEAERLAHETLAIGQRIGTPSAEGFFAGQIFAVRREQGRLRELEPALAAVAQTQRALPSWPRSRGRREFSLRCARCGRGGHVPRSRRLSSRPELDRHTRHARSGRRCGAERASGTPDPHDARAVRGPHDRRRAGGGDTWLGQPSPRHVERGPRGRGNCLASVRRRAAPPPASQCDALRPALRERGGAPLPGEAPTSLNSSQIPGKSQVRVGPPRIESIGTLADPS
jgi:DNA-binding winged helix-turn-helix (wHTH) protein